MLLEDGDPNKFVAKMGAEAIYDLLKDINLDDLSPSCAATSRKARSSARPTPSSVCR